jgi:uncharacterized cupin superfamily protein
MLRIFDLNACPSVPMERGRGETVRLVNSSLGTEKLDVHLNRLVPGGARGRVHRHTNSDNIYIVRRGEGCLRPTADPTLFGQTKSYSFRPEWRIR